MKKFIIAVLSCLFFVSCQQNEEPKEILSNSIFQLDSDWETQDGEKIKLASLQGKTLVMVMIYTSCKTACPRLTADMRRIDMEVGDKHSDETRYVLISIDPKADTTEKMKQYLKDNELTGEQWMFIRSDEASTKELANVLAVKYKQISPIDFSHSNIISVFSKNGVLAYQKDGLEIDISSVVQEVKKQQKAK